MYTHNEYVSAIDNQSGADVCACRRASKGAALARVHVRRSLARVHLHAPDTLHKLVNVCQVSCEVAWNGGNTAAVSLAVWQLVDCCALRANKMARIQTPTSL